VHSNWLQFILNVALMVSDRFIRFRKYTYQVNMLFALVRFPYLTYFVQRPIICLRAAIIGVCLPKARVRGDQPEPVDRQDCRVQTAILPDCRPNNALS